MSPIRLQGSAGPMSKLRLIEEPAVATDDSPDAAKSSKKESKIDLKYLVRALLKYNASDLHLKAGRPALYRINGKITASKMPVLTADQVQALIYSVLTSREITDLELERQIDFSFMVPDIGRFRCHVFYQLGSISAAIRMIPFAIPNLDQLGVPPVIKELTQRPRGLILITGATGSGKSTTLASVIQYINETAPVHILTIENPIEFIYQDAKASITQRELGADVHTMQQALYGGLRQDPDVIMIGEMRDCETIQAALTAAETGHLVISTLHTNDAKSTIDRILDVFPAEGQNQIRIQLAYTLVGVISQQLLTRADGKGRVLAAEVMVKSPTIENYILKNERDKIADAISQSSTYYEMQSMNMAIEALIKSGTVTREEGLRGSNNPDDLILRLSGVGREEGYNAVDLDHIPD